jgi:hypothetical protein
MLQNRMLQSREETQLWYGRPVDALPLVPFSGRPQRSRRRLFVLLPRAVATPCASLKTRAMAIVAVRLVTAVVVVSLAPPDVCDAPPLVLRALCHGSVWRESSSGSQSCSDRRQVRPYRGGRRPIANANPALSRGRGSFPREVPRAFVAAASLCHGGRCALLVRSGAAGLLFLDC